MIRTLFIIAGAALVLCAVTVGGALAIGGHDLQRHGWAWTFRTNDGETVRIERVRGDEADDMGPTVTRTLTWTGGDALRIDSAIDVEYVQGDAATVVVTGPRALAERVRLDGGRLWLGQDEDGRVVNRSVIRYWNHNGLHIRSEPDELHVVVTAPAVERFDLNGSRSLTIANYDRPRLAIALAGSGEVTASGHTAALSLDISGSGEAELADLDARDAEVSISGSGDARIAATGTASIDIAGSGDVRLATRPAKVTTSVSGSGEVTQD